MSDNEQNAPKEEMEVENFDSVGAGAALWFPMQCSALRKGGMVLIKNHPCKIIDMSTSKTGKHGHAKVHLTAVDIFTNRKYEELSPSTHNMEVPNVTRTEFQLINIEDGFLEMINIDGVTKDDVKVPEGELGEQLEAAFEKGDDIVVTVVSAMGTEQAMSYKEGQK